MPEGYGTVSHSVYDIKFHLIWVTKYRYKILSGEIALRLRELVRQGCEARGIKILSGNIGDNICDLEAIFVQVLMKNL